MAESVVSVACEHLFSLIANQPSHLSNVKPELEGLRTQLSKLRNSAGTEQKEELLVEMSQIAYEAEDVIDTFVSASKSLFNLYLANKTSKQLRKLTERTQVINSKLENDNESSNSPKLRARGWRPSRSHLNAEEEEEEYVVGIERDVETLVKQLITGKFGDGDQPSNFDALAIVGMGGSGKTTLARNIYNHADIKEHFQRLVWVTPSQQQNATAILYDILKQTAAVRGNKSNKRGLAHDHHANNNDELLVVLDDVWEWGPLNEVLQVLMQHDEFSPGRDKIVITTRNRALSSPDSGLWWLYYDTHCLNEMTSWTLFEKVASKDGTTKGLDPEYKVLGMEMLTKCQGLPLAIVALAKLLKTKDSIQEWESVFSNLQGKESTYLYRPVNEILAVSYDELSYYLKPCFLYLGLFPKGSSISAGTLIRMWIAEGFVCKGKDEDTVEDAARRYLQELINHCMVQVETKNYAGQVKTIRVHDIMRDLCLSKASELDFLTVLSSNSDVTSMNSRRVAINLSLRCSLPVQMSRLRSLLLFRQSNASLAVDGYADKRNQVTLNLEPICANLKLLRVLDISGIKTVDGTLPKQIGNLIHLRYLTIRSTNIRELPKSIGKLCNLLTLDYWDVSVNNEITLPNELSSLTQLRHLYLPNEMGKVNGELKLHTMNALQTLWGVGGGDWMLKEMNSMSYPLKKLYIHAISSHEQKNALLNSPIINHLNILALEWYGFELDSLGALTSNSNVTLKKLRLMGKASDELNDFPSSLQKLELYYTQLKNPRGMEALVSLRSLKFLKLSKDSYIGNEWTCSDGQFENLEELKLSNLQNLEEWKMEKGTMPSLRKLSIVSCIKLRRAPEGLEHLSTLKKLEIERMPYNFCSKLQKVQKQEVASPEENFYDTVKHFPEIQIRDVCVSLS